MNHKQNDIKSGDVIYLTYYNQSENKKLFIVREYVIRDKEAFDIIKCSTFDNVYEEEIIRALDCSKITIPEVKAEIAKVEKQIAKFESESRYLHDVLEHMGEK